MQSKVKTHIDLLETFICSIFMEVSLIQTPDFKSGFFDGEVGRSAFPNRFVEGLFAKTFL